MEARPRGGAGPSGRPTQSASSTPFGELALATKTIQRLLVAKGLCTHEDFRTTLRQLTDSPRAPWWASYEDPSHAGTGLSQVIPPQARATARAPSDRVVARLNEAAVDASDSTARTVCRMAGRRLPDGSARRVRVTPTAPFLPVNSPPF